MRVLLGLGGRLLSSGINAPLHSALRNSDNECVRLLLDHGADRMVVDCLGAPAMMRAFSRDKSLARLFLREPLHLAVIGDRAPSELLGDVNKPECGGVCALHLAVRFASERTVALLVEAGADPSAVTSWGETVLHFAAGRPALAMRFIGACAIDAQDALGRTPFCCAVGNSHWDLAEALLLAGCDVNLSPMHGTPLSISMLRLAPISLVRSMLKRGANASDPRVVYAVTCYHGGQRGGVYGLDGLQLMLDHGARVRSTCEWREVRAWLRLSSSEQAKSILRNEHVRSVAELRSLRDGSHPLVAQQASAAAAEVARAGMELGQHLGAETHALISRARESGQLAALVECFVSAAPKIVAYAEAVQGTRGVPAAVRLAMAQAKKDERALHKLVVE